MYDVIPQRCAAESYFVKKIICMIFDYPQEKKTMEDTHVLTGANELKNNRPCSLALAGICKCVPFFISIEVNVT